MLSATSRVVCVWMGGEEGGNGASEVYSVGVGDGIGRRDPGG